MCSCERNSITAKLPSRKHIFKDSTYIRLTFKEKTEVFLSVFRGIFVVFHGFNIPKFLCIYSTTSRVDTVMFRGPIVL